jgi:hypothetical protein
VTGRLVLGSALRRPRQLLVVAGAVLVAALTVTAVAVFAGELERRVAADLRGFGPNLVVRPQVGGPGALALGELAAIRALPGVEGAAALREARARLRLGRDEGGVVVTLEPHDDGVAVLAASGEVLELYRGWEVEGRWPQAGEALIGARLSLPAAVPAALDEGGRGVAAHRVTGRVSTGGDLDHGAVLALPADPGAPVHRFEVRAAPHRIEQVRAALLEHLAGADVEPVRRVSESDRRFGGRVAALLAAIALLTVALVTLAVFAATTALVDERRGEIGLLLALGLDPRRVAWLLGLELLVAALVAAALGELGGWAVGDLLTSRILGLAAAGPGAALAPLVAGPLVALGVVAAAASLALRRVARLDPARVLCGE